LEINHFKVFGNRMAFILTPERKNLLLYGENGSGKTSFYEAVKLVFFRQRLLGNRLKIGATVAERQNEEQAFYNEYLHKGDTQKIELRLNDVDFKDINRDSYQCFMLSNIDVDGVPVTGRQDGINLKNLLSNAFLDCPNIDAFVNGHIGEVVREVNQTLHDKFVEDIEVGQENDAYDMYILDKLAGLRASYGLHQMFNEAKVNLVRLLLLLTCVRLLKSSEPTKHRILVLDDVVTSLDASNRLYIIKYIQEEFADFQKVVLTHNIGFNNLFVAYLKRYGNPSSWQTLNLYQTNLGCNLYDYDELKTAVDIEDAFSKGFLQPGTVGNEIRKRFEAVMSEILNLLRIGASEQVSDLTGRLVQEDKPIYLFKKDGKTLLSNDLVNSLQSILESETDDREKVRNAKEMIAKFSCNPELQKIIPIIKEIKTYQKIVIHQLSHGHACMPNFNQKEVECAMLLLKQLEKDVDLLKRKNVWTM